MGEHPCWASVVFWKVLDVGSASLCASGIWFSLKNSDSRRLASCLGIVSMPNLRPFWCSSLDKPIISHGCYYLAVNTHDICHFPKALHALSSLQKTSVISTGTPDRLYVMTWLAPEIFYALNPIHNYQLLITPFNSEKEPAINLIVTCYFFTLAETARKP